MKQMRKNEGASITGCLLLLTGKRKIVNSFIFLLYTFLLRNIGFLDWRILYTYLRTRICFIWSKRGR